MKPTNNFEGVLMKKLALSITFFFALLIGTARAQNEPSLKIVMINLEADMEAIVRALNYDDFETIKASAMKIADHDKPSMAQRKKIMGLLGNEMADFKEKDSFVHNSAVKVAEAAGDKDHNLVVERYAILLNGCTACHTKYRSKIVEHLKEK
jgi:cytochrome c556